MVEGTGRRVEIAVGVTTIEDDAMGVRSAVVEVREPSAEARQAVVVRDVAMGLEAQAVAATTWRVENVVAVPRANAVVAETRARRTSEV